MTTVCGVGVVAVVLSAWISPVGTQDAGREPEALRAGMRHVQNGEFEAGLLAIDTAVRQLEVNVEQWRDLLATAHIYQGMALLGLGDTGLAHTKLLRGAELDSSRRLDPTEFPPRVIRAFERARHEVLARRRSRGVKVPLLVGGGTAAAVAAVAIAVGRSDEADTEPTVDLRLNGQETGAFPCTSGLFFTISIANPTSTSLHVDSFSLNFTALSTQCQSHDAPVDGTVNRDVVAGATDEIRRIDLAGDLCLAAGRSPGCSWRASVLLVTGAGTLGDQIEFSTTP